MGQTIAIIILGALALAATLACILLLRNNSRLAQRAASATAERDALAAEHTRTAASLDTAERTHNELRTALETERIRAAKLQEQADSLRRARDEYERQLEKRLADQEEKFRQSIDALAAKALQQTSDHFLKRAGEHFETRTKAVDDLVKPISETLKLTNEKLIAFEKHRAEQHAGLHQHLAHIIDGARELREGTEKLANALRKPHVRGQYGEVQLQRVAELAGMRAYCDFSTQHSTRDADGNLVRPDMVVRLPNERIIAVDAKTNIEAYLDAIQTKDPDEAARHLDRFARHVADQAQKLAAKNYWSSFTDTPEFVVMFIPGDQFVDAALERQPDILERAAQQGVLLASPSTLIGLLRAVAVGWRERALTDSADELFRLGKELHERAAVALGHAADIGRAIDQARRKYNDFVGSVDARLMPTLRRFEESGAKSNKQIDGLTPLDEPTRELPPSFQ